MTERDADASDTRMCAHPMLLDRLNYEHLCEPPVECPDCHQMIEVEYEESFDGEDEQQFFWLQVVSNAG